MFLAMTALMNTLFGYLFASLIGRYDLTYFAWIMSGTIAYAFVFALLIWRVDSSGLIGRLLGADKESKQKRAEVSAHSEGRRAHN